jgi:hypothetical protein
MDQDSLKKLAQFRILMKKEKGVQIDFEKLLSDTTYARHNLSLAEDSDNEILVILALGLRQELGLLSPAPQGRAPAQAAVPHNGKKYVFGARS